MPIESRQGVGCWNEVAGGAREEGAEVSVGRGGARDRPLGTEGFAFAMPIPKVKGEDRSEK